MKKKVQKKRTAAIPKQKIVVIYHGQCPDGFGGAWAAWKRFGNRAAYLPARDRSKPPAPLKNKIIYLIDYTYNEPIVRKLMKDNIRVTAIDHHESQKAFTLLTEDHRYSTRHSGAVLAWNYFHPGTPIPMLLKYVEDRDIWKWRVPHSLEMLMVLDLTDFDFGAWSRLAKEFDDPGKRAVRRKEGVLLARYYEALWRKLLPNAERVRFADKTIYALNCPYFFADDLGHELALRTGTFALLWNESGGRIRCSLRSAGKTDVARIAKRFGGGGHRESSGFSFMAGEKPPWKLLSLSIIGERVS